MTKDERMNP